MSALPKLYWDKSLAYQISPKSGPMRQLETLADVRSALIEDLPPGTTKIPHWLKAGMQVVAASESGASSDIRAATDAIADALDTEGWLSTTVEAAH